MVRYMSQIMNYFWQWFNLNVTTVISDRDSGTIPLLYLYSSHMIIISCFVSHLLCCLHRSYFITTVEHITLCSKTYKLPGGEGHMDYMFPVLAKTSILLPKASCYKEKIVQTSIFHCFGIFVCVKQIIFPWHITDLVFLKLKYLICWRESKRKMSEKCYENISDK